MRVPAGRTNTRATESTARAPELRARSRSPWTWTITCVPSSAYHGPGEFARGAGEPGDEQRRRFRIRVLGRSELHHLAGPRDQRLLIAA